MNKTTPARDPAGHEPSSQTTDPDAWRNPKVLTSVAAGALLLIGWLLRLAEVPGTTSLVLYLTAIPIGGYYFGREAIEELLIERRVGIELLMSTAAVVAALTGQIAEGAILVFLYSISEAAEEYTEEKTRAAIRALMELAPQQALVRRNGEEIPVSVGELRVGDTFIVKPGQSVPTDGEIKIGASSVDQAPVTGESVPVEKGPGDAVFAGSINGEGALEVRATKSFADNTISRIVRMVEEAQERKGRNQRFIERFGARYSPAVLLVGALVAVVPPLAFSAEWSTWVTRGTVFIVAAAPCALVISIPITLVASLGTAARQGVLIKGGIYLEELAKVSVVAMDKTGTLTRGEPEVTDVVVLLERVQGETLSGQILLGLAAGIERRSNHPLAQAIVRHAEQRSAPQMELSDFHSLTGAGASARLDGRPVHVGSPEMFRRKLGLSFSSAQEKIDQLQKEGKTVVAVGEEEELWGLIALRDRVRPNARQALDDLHAAGIEKVVMLTGDSEPTARAIAAQLGIDNVYSELRPEDKVAKVRQLAERYGQVAMVGDGVNDAPALAEASIGIAMGAAGSDVALETADVALMADELEKLAYAIGLARRNRAVVNQNLVLSSIVILFFVAGAVAGTFSLPITVLGHEVSEFVVIGSGLRMLRA